MMLDSNVVKVRSYLLRVCASLLVHSVAQDNIVTTIHARDE